MSSTSCIDEPRCRAEEVPDFHTGGRHPNITRGFRVPFEPPQGNGHTPVIFGEAGDESFSDAVSLEILGLVLHPFKRTLEPMRMMLA